MAKISTCVDFALIELEGLRWDSAPHVWNQILTLKAQFRFLTSFLDDGVHFNLASLLRNIEVVLNFLIKNVAVEAGSLSFLIRARELMEDTVSDTNLALSRLLEMIEIVKAEVFLIELLNYNANLMVLAKERISAFHQWLQFLREFGKLILTHIEALVRLAVLLDNSCVADRINADILFKLFSTEFFLMVPLDGNTSLIDKDGIDNLYQGLTFLREFLLDVPEENLRKLKLIEAVASEAASLVFSYSEEKIREDTADRMNGLLSYLLEKIKHLMAEATARHLQISRDDSIACVDYQIEVLLRELEFLRSFLWENAHQHNEHQELKDLVTCVTDIACEAEYVIDSFEVKDGPIRCLVLWLFGVIEVISMATQITGIYARKIYVGDHNVAKTLRHMKLEANTPTIHEVVVALDDQAEDIINQLAGGDILSIVGMPGIGNTTLAN